MPGSSTTPGRPGARVGAPVRLAFRHLYGVGAQKNLSFAAQWLACAIPCRRFAAGLAASNARLGADAGRYSFIVSDFHRLLLAGLPAHFESDMPSHAVGLCEEISDFRGRGRPGVPRRSELDDKFLLRHDHASCRLNPTWQESVFVSSCNNSF